jgi:hypothetical protein
MISRPDRAEICALLAWRISITPAPTVPKPATPILKGSFIILSPVKYLIFLCAGTLYYSGFPIPKSIMPSLAAREWAFIALTFIKTYGGKRRIL